MQQWRGGLVAAVRSFWSLESAKIRTRLAVRGASEKSGVKKWDLNPQTHQCNTAKCTSFLLIPDVSPCVIKYPAFKTLHPPTALLTSVLQTLKPLNSQRTTPILGPPPSATRSSLWFGCQLWETDVKLCTVLPRPGSLRSLCVLLKALPLWGWRKAFSPCRTL